MIQYMEITVRKAIEQDIKALGAMYDRIIDQQEACPTSPKWTKGVYPTEKSIGEEVRKGEVIAAFSGDTPVGAVIRNHIKATGYDECPWQVEAEAEEVFFIHTLGIDPDWQKRGVGRKLVEAVENDGRAHGMKAVRLDVILQNEPSKLLFLSMGYELHGVFTLYYDSVEPQPFMLFEKVLE